MRTGTNDPQLIETAERRAFVLKLRKTGATYERIAQAAMREFGLERLPRGWDRRYAFNDVKRVLQKLNRECRQSVTEIKRLELERIDVAVVAIWPEVKDGNLGAIDRFLKTSARRAALCGLDAPTKMSIKVDDIDQLIECELEKLAAARQAGDPGKASEAERNSGEQD